MKNKTSHLLQLLIAPTALLPMFMTTSALAQDRVLEEIVVTAQFREQRLQDTPLSITAISGEMLEARGQTNIAEVAAQAPNVTLEQGVGQRGGGLIAYIRGIGQYNGAPHYEAGVGTYVDDVYFASMQSSLLNLIDLDRVEVLRGPQGTLAGKNTVGGAIKIFSRKPEGDGTGYAQISYGDYDRIDTRGAFDFAITENLFMRANFASRSEDGYVDRLDYACANPGSGLPLITANDDCLLGTQGGNSYVGGRVALRWLATDRIEVNFATDYTNDSSDPAAEQVKIVTPANLAFAASGATLNGVTYDEKFDTSGTYTSYSTYCNLLAYGGDGAYCSAPRNETDSWGSSAVVDIMLNDALTFKSITAYRGYRSDITIDGDNSPLTITNTNIGYHGHQASQEFRLNADISDKMDLTVGTYFLDAYINGDNRVDIQYINLLFINDDEVDSTSKAFYSQLSYDLTDRLNLIGGLRYSDEEKDYTFYRTNPDGNNTPQPGLFGLTGAYEESRWDYRANLNFALNDDTMVYGQYATGFKAGGTNGQPFFPDQVYSFDSESIKTVEVGAKMQFADRRVTLNVSAFFSDYEDIQLQAQSCPPPSPPFPCAGPQNVGSADLKGIEAEVFAELDGGLRLDASLAYLDFEYTELRDTPNISLDMIAPFTPEVSASLGLEYGIDLSGMGTLVPRIDFTYRDSIYTDPTNGINNMIPSRTLANMRVAWYSPDEDWEVSLLVTNLTDKYFLNNLIDNDRFTGLAYTYPGAPQRWQLTAKHQF